MIKTDEYIKIKPVIIYPTCIKSGKRQDCFKCVIFKKNLCKSPRSLCAKEYIGHKKGCPNYGKYDLCPPNAPMFDEVFDMNKDIYLIYYKFDIKTHMEKMKKNHPDWTDRQLRNVLYWQGTAKKHHKEEIKRFLSIHPDYEVAVPEAMGIDVNKTLDNVGIELEWPPINYSYRIALAGITKEGKSLKNYESCKSNHITNLNLKR